MQTKRYDDNVCNSYASIVNTWCIGMIDYQIKETV